jgi:hypothetical protein
MGNRIGTLLGFVAMLALLAPACATAPPPDAVFVPAGPPVAVVETVGVAPGPDFVWIRGHHRWTGSAYAWDAGRWERRPHAGAVWHDGQWVHHSKGWYWREGHW